MFVCLLAGEDSTDCSSTCNLSPRYETTQLRIVRELACESRIPVLYEVRMMMGSGVDRGIQQGLGSPQGVPIWRSTSEMPFLKIPSSAASNTIILPRIRDS